MTTDGRSHRVFLVCGPYTDNTFEDCRRLSIRTLFPMQKEAAIEGGFARGNSFRSLTQLHDIQARNFQVH